MTADFDVIVVGSGPAGVSAALPLAEAGLQVLLVDGGREATQSPQPRPFLTSRAEDDEQWKWMIGQDFHALRNDNAISPKLRVPIHAPVFEGFSAANKIDSDGFVALGSLARGGLSNAWGCGVARLSRNELSDYPFPATDIESSYESVTRRIGVSGAGLDDMTDYFGLDEWADPPIQMDALHSRLLRHYESKRSAVTALGLRLGAARVAVLANDRAERKGCNLSGNCLWGCHRRSIYCATQDLERLTRFANVTYRSGFIVQQLSRTPKLRLVEGVDASGRASLSAKKVILAAGTLASTRLALRAINLTRPVTMQSSPTAAFLLWLPAMLGSGHTHTFGLGQLAFSLSISPQIRGFGSLFNTTGIPIAEFSKHLPLRKRPGIDFLRNLLCSSVVGNLFLPGQLTTSRLSLRPDDTLRVEGGYADEVPLLMGRAEKQLRKIFWKLGALLLPGSFSVGAPGSDIHYAGSIPMRETPTMGETSRDGELFGFDGVHIADGASLCTLTEKSHTLTIMANADRIGRQLALEFSEMSKR